MSNHSLARSARFRLAIVASLIARSSGIALQVIALPIAAAALSSAGFAVYALSTAILGWLTLSNFGIGPALTVRVSDALGRGDDPLAGQLFVTGTALMAFIVALVSIITLLLLYNTDILTSIFLKTNISYYETLDLFNTIIFVFAITMMILPFESVQAAYQETHYTNIYVSVGTLCAAICTVTLAALHPTPLSIILAVQVPTLIARFLSCLHCLLRHRALASALKRPQWQHPSRLLAEGTHFFLSGSATNFLSHVFPILLIGTLASPNDIATTAAVMGSVTILSSFFELTNQPLLGALPEARLKKDINWIKDKYRTILISNLCFSFIILIIFGVFGKYIFNFWYQGVVNPSNFTLLFAGIYLVLRSIDFTHTIFISGFGNIKKISYVLFLKSIIYAILIYTFSNETMIELIFLFLIISTFLFSMGPLYLIFLRCINSIR